MKKLVLVRHGKSSWDYNVDDKDRPLQERGINDGHLVGAAFKPLASQIDAAFSSPANRALHTCMIVLREIGFSFDKFRLTNELYDFSGDQVSQFVRNFDNSWEKVIIFGHNYAFTNIANQWGNKPIDNVPTSGLVQLSFNTDKWESIDRGISEHVIFPKQLR